MGDESILSTSFQLKWPIFKYTVYTIIWYQNDGFFSKIHFSY